MISIRSYFLLFFFSFIHLFIVKDIVSKETRPDKLDSEFWAVTFDFHPQVTNFTAQDSLLSAYGFQPVENLFMPSFGLRGWFRHKSQFLFGLTMNYGILSKTSTRRGVNDTVVQFNSFAAIAGWRFWLIDITLDTGFAARSIAVGNDIEGGSLTYLGPYMEFQVAYTILEGPYVLGVALGYAAHFSVGNAHNQPLWADSFAIPVFHSFTLSIRSGFGS